jgi:diaminohydroxyphosphoribosylaminopyrimidine deaminase / 5-amino-6-(5-phosphoribosylamino)uracil reductase
VTVLCVEPPARRRRALESLGVVVLPVPAGAHGRIALRPALEVLRGRGLLSLMVEGGGELLGSFLAERLLDEVVIFRAPLLLGGAGSRAAFGGPDPLRIGEALRLAPAAPTGAERELLGTGTPYEWWAARARG